MNIFIIPSWYPSASHPLTGIFFREQALALASQFEDDHFGISTWGQNDDRLLLWAGQPLSSVSKLKRKPGATTHELSKNLIEYFTPAFTWTSKIRAGNIENIIAANEENLKLFESRFGKADIIHAHVGYPAGFIAKKLSEIRGIPNVITEHMSPFPHAQFVSSTGQLNKQLREGYASAGTNICVSKNLQEQMRSFGISDTTVIPNLIDEDFFKPGPELIKNKKTTFFSLGRMVPQKGIDILLQAFALMEEEAELRIGGGGEYLDNYKQLARQLGLDKSVKWLGELNKATTLREFQRCDIFVLPSRHESMGIVFAEAMACAKPVIATRCGGPEHFINEDVGLLVEPEDVARLASGMNKMTKQFGDFDPKSIRQHAITHFSKQKICMRLRETYQEVIDGFNQ